MESLTGKDAQGTEVVVRMATAAEPYHFVGSGLGNVYLVGVEYRVDLRNGLQSAVIPCLPSLMEAIGKVLVEKSTALTSDELRFLRKRLRYASKVFAKLVGVSEEQYSRLENGATITPTMERLVRLIYATLAKLPPAASEGVATTSWSASLNGAECIVATLGENQRWVVQTTAA
jgi:transcriptional regulator with XRE-family HTH domain